MFEVAWTLDGAGPAESGALRHATISDDVAVIGRTVVDPVTGAIRWTAEQPLVGLDGGAAIVVRADGDRWVAIERRDRLTGAVSGEVALTDAAGAPAPLRSFNGGLALGGGHLLYTALGKVRAFALATGREAWTATVRGTSAVVVPSGDLLGLVDDGATLVAVRARDGVEQWRAPFSGSDADLIASPRGGFFIPRGDQTIEVDAGGQAVRTMNGRFSAASGDLVATVAGHDVVVYDGRGGAVERIEPAGAGDFVAAPGLCPKAVVYYRNRDTTVAWHAEGGKEQPVVKLVPRTGSIDGQPPRAVAPTLTEPPRCAGALLLVQDWFITAYRIPAS